MEICWLMPKAKQQFRLRGCWQPAATQAEAERQRHWQQLSPAGRALWAWPAPGRPQQPSDQFVEELSAETEIPEHFQLLRFQIERVEQLDLGQHPHLRRSWQRQEQWRALHLRP